MAGISRWERLPLIVETIQKMQPQHVLDVGGGFGLIGFLIRCYIDNWKGYEHPKQFKTVVDYCDPHCKFTKDSFQPFIYNRIFAKDFIEISDDLRQYDTITIFDVLQHTNKPNGTQILEILEKFGGNILMSQPLGQAWLRKSKRSHESHISFWNKEQILKYGFKELDIYTIPDGREIGLFIK